MSYNDIHICMYVSFTYGNWTQVSGIVTYKTTSYIELDDKFVFYKSEIRNIKTIFENCDLGV